MKKANIATSTYYLGCNHGMAGGDICLKKKEAANKPPPDA
jgi:hypothetical protein